MSNGDRGGLWEALVGSTDRALRSGALQPISTAMERIEDGGVGFIVRVADNLRRKERAEHGDAKRSADFDPFLPPDPEMFVKDISPTHLGLLNKFNVVDHHLLIVTRKFEDQDAPLTTADFSALWRCMAEFDGLGFYNGGRAAGASQRHRHLQMVPLPLAPGDDGTPLDDLLAHTRPGDSIGTIEDLPFRHAVARVEPAWLQHGADAKAIAECYRQMRAAVCLEDGQPFNLLATRSWMWLVPRTHERFESISINSLAFAGSLFVRNIAELERVREVGPVAILKQVTR